MTGLIRDRWHEVEVGEVFVASIAVSSELFAVILVEAGDKVTDVGDLDRPSFGSSP